MVRTCPVLQYGVGFNVHKANCTGTCVKAQTPTGEIVEIRSHVFQCNPDGLDRLSGHFLQKYRARHSLSNGVHWGISLPIVLN